jgi:hypothetical protein
LGEGQDQESRTRLAAAPWRLALGAGGLAARVLFWAAREFRFFLGLRAPGRGPGGHGRRSAPGDTGG